MQIIVLLIAISLTIAVIALIVFIWNIKNGQYDDTFTPSIRMLFDNKPDGSSSEKLTNNSEKGK
jgi:cbb3-type cytochrome oxidase maturation protein